MAKSPADIRARARSVFRACSAPNECRELRGAESKLSGQCSERGIISLRARTNHHVNCWQTCEQSRAHYLTKPSFKTVSFDDCMFELRHDESYPRMIQKGSRHPDLEVLGPEALPLSCNSRQLGASRQPIAAREAAAFRRRRTLSAT